MDNSEYWDKTIVYPTAPGNLPKDRLNNSAEKASFYSEQTIIYESNPFKTFAYNLRDDDYKVTQLAAGQRLGKYIINKFIGNGNFSKIYEAKHVYLNNSVALKTLYNPQRVDPKIFLREAQSLAILSHENVVKVFDADIFDGVPCIVLEHLDGNTLQQSLSKHRQLTLERTLDFLEQIGGVLVRQEEKQILHLDIKPANIFIRPNGSFCLFDYGLVSIGKNEIGGQSRYMVGTPAYMAPEQFLGNADKRSDLYSLGLTAWECLTGQSARQLSDKTIPLAQTEIMSTPLKPLTELHQHFPGDLSEIISHLTAINPDDRYETAKDFIEDLSEFRYRSRVPIGPTRGSAFVAIPFSPDFIKVFNAIANTTKATSLRARRLDQHIYFGKDIWSQCVQELEIARVVIADFSEIKPFIFPNPNVVTEASHARAIHKNLIIIKQGSPDTIPFDWRFTPVIPYENTEEGLKKLEYELLIRLKKIMED